MNDPVDLGVITLIRGDGWRIPITDVATDGTPTDLTGFGSGWSAQMRETADASTSVAFTVDATAAASGQLVLSLAGYATAALTRSRYVFDVQATGGTITPLTVYRGAILVERDVTRP